MRIIISILLIILAALGASAQRATVERVEPIPFEVIPALQQRKDLNGEPCALVRVEVIADDVKFSGNIIGEVEHATGHYRVFLSPGTKMLRIESNSFLPVFITFPDYGIKGVQPNGVYVITLSLPQTPATTPLKTGTLSVNYEPAGAAITIDNKPYGTTPSTIANLSVGQHTVTISSDGYTPANISAIISEDQLFTLTGALSLKPAVSQPLYSNVSDEVTYTSYLDTSTYTHGYKDENGKIVIPAKFNYAGIFSEGVAMVMIKDKYGFIDKTGKIVIPIKFDWAWMFSEGLARVKIKDKWGFINKTGKFVIPLNFEAAGDFSEGLAAVKLNGKYGYIDKTREYVIPAKYDDAIQFSEGLAAVKLYGKWGYINKTGQLVITDKFESAWPFKNGKAKVKLNGREFSIDRQGNEVK